MARIVLLNGPNLNLLGTREPGVYGHTSLHDVEQRCAAKAAAAGLEFTALQSNSELVLLERIHACRHDDTRMIVINPAAFTHQSVALRDALAAVAIPFIEVHLSNPKAREMFRHHSLFSDLAVGVISGFGAEGYEFAMTAAIRRLGVAS